MESQQIEKLQCPNCKSRAFYYRTKTKDSVCKRCGTFFVSNELNLNLQKSETESINKESD